MPPHRRAMRRLIPREAARLRKPTAPYAPQARVGNNKPEVPAPELRRSKLINACAFFPVVDPCDSSCAPSSKRYPPGQPNPDLKHPTHLQIPTRNAPLPARQQHRTIHVIPAPCAAHIDQIPAATDQGVHGATPPRTAFHSAKHTLPAC